jgi:hypothetical protein
VGILKMSVETVCKEKYVDGKLVSRICIKGNLFNLKNEFRPPDYEISEVSSCDSCPAYPPATTELQKDEIRAWLKEILKDLLQK